KDDAAVRVRRLGGGDVQVRKRYLLGIICRINPKALADDCVIAGLDAVSIVEDEHRRRSRLVWLDGNRWRAGSDRGGTSFLGGRRSSALVVGWSRHFCSRCLIGLELFQD